MYLYPIDELYKPTLGSTTYELFLLNPSSEVNLTSRLQGQWRQFWTATYEFVKTSNDAFTRPQIKAEFLTTSNGVEYALDFVYRYLDKPFLFLYQCCEALTSANAEVKAVKVNGNFAYLKKYLDQFEYGYAPLWLGIIDTVKRPWELGQYWFYHFSEIMPAPLKADFETPQRDYIFTSLIGWHIVDIELSSLSTEFFLSSFDTTKTFYEINRNQQLFMISPCLLLTPKIEAKQEGRLWRFTLLFEFLP